MYLLNAFSANMIPGSCVVEFTEMSVESTGTLVRNAHLPLVSAVGHAGTAALFSQVLDHPVEFNRANVMLDAGSGPNSYAILGQYSGPRLPEGATELPEGASIRWYFICVFPHHAAARKL